MLNLARYYEQFEVNSEEMIKYYSLAIENDSKDGAISLIEYFTYLSDIPNIIKYTTIAADKFNDINSIVDLIKHYSNANDEQNSLKYSDKLIEVNANKGFFMKGTIFENLKKYNEMIIEYTKFLDTVNLSNTSSILIERNFMYVVLLFINNEINLTYVQSVLQKHNIQTQNLWSHLQYKLNKLKLVQPPYSKVGRCNICLDDDVTLQIFDCIGHYYCRNCTITINHCSFCKCTKKCSHM